MTIKIVPASGLDFRVALECALEVCLGHPDQAEFTLEEFHKAIVVPIRKGHCFFGLDSEKTVVALMTWAFLTEEGVARLVSGEFLLDTDWEAGNSFWLVDCVAPWGHAFKFTRTLRKLAPRAMPVNWRRSSSERLGQYLPRSMH